MCYYFWSAPCPVQGQVRKSCAAHPGCTRTCTNRFAFRFCPQVCIVNGCECPTGTVVDRDLNRCVLPSEWPESMINKCTASYIISITSNLNPKSL